ISVENKKVKEERYGDTYAALMRELMSKTNVERGEEARWNEFRRLLEHSIGQSPFYRKIYQGIELKAIQGIGDLPKLPLLDREAIQQHIHQMHAVEGAAAAGAHEIDREGVPLKFLLTKEDIQKRNAFMDFYKQQNGGASRAMKQAIFTSRKIVPKAQQKKAYWRDNRPENIRLYSNYHC